LFALSKYYIIDRKPLNTGWPEMEKGNNSIPLKKEQKEKIMGILSKHVSHCLEELSIE